MIGKLYINSRIIKAELTYSIENTKKESNDRVHYNREKNQFYKKKEKKNSHSTWAQRNDLIFNAKFNK